MRPKISSAIRVIGAIITIAVAAQITLDIGNIPITGQTLAILSWAFFLSKREAMWALGIYLITGICGVPIFADGGNGVEKLFGGSGGYLIGFLASAIIVSSLQHRYNPTSFLSIIGITILGTVVILLFGIGRLISLYGIETGIEYGLIPFWKGAILKILIGSVVVWIIKMAINKRAKQVK